MIPCNSNRIIIKELHPKLNLVGFKMLNPYADLTGISNNECCKIYVGAQYLEPLPKFYFVEFLLDKEPIPLCNRKYLLL